MSRRNKVNPDHYTIAGRLAPDDMARERRKQADQLRGATRERQRKPVPPWMANDAGDMGKDAGANATESSPVEAVEAEDAPAINVSGAANVSDEAAQQPQAKPSRSGMGKQQAGGSNRKKTARRKAEAGKQQTRTGTTRGARSAKAKPRTTPKASGARGSAKTRKAPRSRGSAARGGSPQRAGKPGARAKKTKSASKARTNRSAKKATTAKRARTAKKAKKR